MTQEDKAKEKELLLNVLKDGLPYGLQLQITDVDEFTFNGELCVLSKNWCRLNITDPVKRAQVKNQTIPLNYIYIKPYLRPMSSMTEEEHWDLYNRFVENNDIDFFDFKKLLNERQEELLTTLMDSWVFADWLNAHHFDYRGLIEKGLAIAVTKENNPYE